MEFAITQGVKVSVTAEYQPYYSSPRLNHYVFSYHIFIQNNSEFAIQLLRRHWYIVDSLGFKKEVKGDGVVGFQPILEPGEMHDYVSGCNFATPIGKMYGNFEMQKLMDGSLFLVQIPAFHLNSPTILN